MKERHLEIADGMKSKGLRLLNKSKRGLVRVLFSRTGLITLLLLMNVGLMVLFHKRLMDLIPAQCVGLVVVLFDACMGVYLLNSSMDPTSKITWLLLIALLPTVGAPLYFYVQMEWGHRGLKKRLNELVRKTRKALPQSVSTHRRLEEQAPEELPLVRYLESVGCHPLYDRCKLTYFSCGEDKFRALKEQLEQAERFIFLEYFIIDEGRMWGEVLEILTRKVAQGVTVRVMYDGSCEFTTLTHDYPERLKKLGIQCKVFFPATPFVSTHYNYRDHRKIAVIDGRVAFTGGVNLADEYINEIRRFGHWKDAALMVEGEAVRSFTLLFLQLWNVMEREPEFTRWLMAYSPHFPEEKGFVVPYGDCPLDEYRVGERVYMDILNRAKDYVHIMSPYLILDGEMETALCFAAQRGVDVKLILPGIPDKKLPYALAKTYYKPLMEAGVKIYEYRPGFIHSKVFVSDDCRGVVGTINLDYRSLYHHFECAAYLYRCPCLADMEADFQETLQACRLVDKDQLKRRPLKQKLSGWLMKAIAPLF